MTSSYRGYARASDNLNSGKVIDPSQKILQRNKEFLEDYRRVREFERQQEAAAFQQYQKNTQTQTNSQVQSADLRAEYGQLVSNQEQENVRKKQAAMQKAFDRKAQEPSNWEKTLSTTKALVDLSTTASKLYGDYKKAEAAAKVQETQDDRVDSFTKTYNDTFGPPPANTPPNTSPVTPQSYMGHKAQTDGAVISATSQGALSAVEENTGNLTAALEQQKNASLTMEGVVNPIKQKLMIKQGFGAELAGFPGTIKKDSGEVVSYQGLSVSEQIKYYDQAKVKILAKQGLNPNGMDKNVLFDLMRVADEASLPVFAAATRSELNASRANDVDNARIMFQEDASPINVQGLYMALQRQAGGDDSTARNNLFDEFKSFNYDQTDVNTFLDAKVPGLNKSWKEQFPGDAQDLINARSTTGIQNAQALDNARELADIQRANAIEEAAINDLEDGVYNAASGEELAEQIAKYTAQGDIQTAAALTKLLPMTPSAQNDTRVETQFEELLLNGIQGDLTPKMVLESGMSNEKKTEWLGKVKQFDATSPSKTENDRAKNYISDSINSRAKFNEFTGKVKDPSINRAIDSAMDQYQADYKQAMLQDGMSIAEAQKYALGRFQEEFGDNEYNGRYRVGNPKTGLPDNAQRSFIDPSFTVQEQIGIYDYNRATLNRAMTVPNAIDQPGLIEHDLLKDISVQSLQRKGMPASIQHVAARSNKPAFEILNRQLKANGLAEIPEAVYTAAEEAQGVVTGGLQSLLNQYPAPTRTDIAMIGSGQEPIYAQTSELGERVKSIFGSRESPQAAYDAINRGSGGDTPGGATKRYGKPLTQMTLGEVKALQAQELNAVGKYQFIEGTLREAAVAAGITDDMLFNEAVQDRIFFTHLDSHGAHNPWEKWWIQQGGPGLALTENEKATIEAFRAKYDPSKPWRQARNMNPSVVAMTVRTKEQGPGSGYWKWDEQRNLWVKSNAN